MFSLMLVTIPVGHSLVVIMDAGFEHPQIMICLPHSHANMHKRSDAFKVEIPVCASRKFGTEQRLLQCEYSLCVVLGKFQAADQCPLSAHFAGMHVPAYHH